MSHPAPAQLAIQAQPGELRRAATWLQAEADARGVPAADIARLDMCLHEAVANIIDHSGLAANAEVQLLLEVEAQAATLTLVDAGHAFDATKAAAPARPATLEDMLPGGLGVVMIRSHSDQLNYEHRDGCNRLGVTVRWSAACP
jgi:anti-sigma regulatory factor (Ser/Thr protein kinase)